MLQWREALSYSDRPKPKQRAKPVDKDRRLEGVGSVERQREAAGGEQQQL